MQSRAWQFLLYAVGTVTLLYGTFTDWADDGSFRLQDHTGGALFGIAGWVAEIGAFVAIGWFAYNALVYTKRPPPASPAIAKVALATVVAASITLACAIVLAIAAHRSVAPPSTLVEADGPQHGLTRSPWFALEGCASLIIGAVSLWRAQRRRA